MRVHVCCCGLMLLWDTNDYASQTCSRRYNFFFSSFFCSYRLLSSLHTCWQRWGVKHLFRMCMMQRMSGLVRMHWAG